MSYLVQNTTYTSPVLNPDGYQVLSPSGFAYGLDLYVEDIPNVSVLKWHPGQIIDLESIATTLQIEQSRHLKVHISEGRMIKL